jgi:eukaryotic-like serine/threonine-protein kinase
MFPTDKYEQLSEFGEGSIAKVIKAKDRKTGATVAIKILKDITDQEDIARLGVEIESISRVRHPNIVSFLTTGKISNVPYVVTEWLQGISLRDLIEDEENFEIQPSIEILLQIVGALVAIHKKGIIHRDIKPENVMLVGNDRDVVKLIDFGMAKLLNQGYNLTIQGQLFGTPQYLAPERITGGEPTSATDIYSLGIMTYELLTGVRPFDGENNQDILMQHLTKRPKPVSTYIDTSIIPRSFLQLVRRMMRQLPEQRPTAVVLQNEFRKTRHMLFGQNIM